MPLVSAAWSTIAHLVRLPDFGDPLREAPPQCVAKHSAAPDQVFLGFLQLLQHQVAARHQVTLHEQGVHRVLRATQPEQGLAELVEAQAAAAVLIQDLKQRLVLNLETDLQRVQSLPHSRVLDDGAKFPEGDLMVKVEALGGQEIYEHLLELLALRLVHVVLHFLVASRVDDILAHYACDDVHEHHRGEEDEGYEVEVPEPALGGGGLHDGGVALQGQHHEVRVEAVSHRTEVKLQFLVVLSAEFERADQSTNVHEDDQEHEDPEHGLEGGGQAGDEHLELREDPEHPHEPRDAQQPEDAHHGDGAQRRVLAAEGEGAAILDE
mmetsp:Transcript_173926/g.557491  ORF Transcript_173926/g.557491 Transcript_173926/m.557491 type:complete len:323 (+) Transcript_173926:1143-2111(+)